MEGSKTLKVATALLKSGYSVIPIVAGTKSPAFPWKEYQETPVTPELLPKWFGNGASIAVIGGRVSSNLCILDFDKPGLWDEFVAACTTNGIDCYASGALFSTPRDGRHLWVRCAAPVGGNKKLARDAEGTCLIETRGEGGYVVTAPSEGYKLLSGRPDKIPTLTAAAFNSLLEIACVFDDYITPSKDKAIGDPVDHAGSPGSDYNARGDYESVLEAAGHTRLHRHGDRQTWQRLGKVGHGISATTGYGGTRMLYVFSTNMPPFEAERKYDPFGVYCRLQHGGDFKAATRQLAAEGYGEQEKPKSRARTPGRSAKTEDEPEKAKTQETDEFSLATAWATKYKNEFCYVEGDQWYRYDHGQWFYSSAERVRRSIQEFIDASKVKVTRAKVSAVQFLAASMIGPLEMSKFDSYPHFIALKNGVYNSLNGELLPHDPKYFITHQTGYEFDKDAACPVWNRCLEEWLLDQVGFPCPDWINLLQEWFGYCLIPDNAAQVSLFWLGEGSNGKGAASRALRGLIGADAMINIPIEQLHDPYHRADVAGKLVGIVNEPDRRAMQKNGNWFKALTGGDDLISARRPTEKVFNFKSVCRIIVTCNHLPTTDDPSRAYFRRIIPIDWRYNVPAEKDDKGLDDKLAAELPGIFNWAMIGLARLRSRNRRFEIPDESKAMLEEYKRSQDTLAQFLENVCWTPKDDSAFIVNKAFYKAYSAYCKDYEVHPVPATMVSTRLPKLGFDSIKKRVNGTSQRGWRGVCIATDKEEPDDDDTP